MVHRNLTWTAGPLTCVCNLLTYMRTDTRASLAGAATNMFLFSFFFSFFVATSLLLLRQTRVCCDKMLPPTIQGTFLAESALNFIYGEFLRRAQSLAVTHPPGDHSRSCLTWFLTETLSLCGIASTSWWSPNRLRRSCYGHF